MIKPWENKIRVLKINYDLNIEHFNQLNIK